MWYEGKGLSNPLAKGPKVMLGGQEFVATVMPAALLDLLKHAQRAREAIERQDLATQLEALLGCAIAVLKPNYPDLTTELISEHGSLTELGRVVTTAVKAAAAQPTLPNYLQKRGARRLH
jgi:hypothetical protein